MDHITISRDVWENMQSALAKAVHYITVPESTPLDVLGRFEAVEDAPNLAAVAQEPRRFDPTDIPRITPATIAAVDAFLSDDSVLAEDATFEGMSEFAQPIPYLPTPRVFERGDIIPDDIKMLKLDSGETKPFQYVNRKSNNNFGYIHALNGWGDPDTSKGMWEWTDFPAVEVVEKVLFTLDETVVHLRHHGIRTDAVRLADYLKNSISWTDFYGKPRGCASNYVVDVSDDFADSDVAFTSAGLSELVSMMRKAAA